MKRSECNNCTNTSYIDNDKRRCRISCNDSAYFNYDQGQCIDCGKGYFLNQTNQTCQTCPANCTSCYFSKGNQRVECDNCSSNLVVDYTAKRCRKSCNST